MSDVFIDQDAIHLIMMEIHAIIPTWKKTTGNNVAVQLTIKPRLVSNFFSPPENCKCSN